MHFPALVEIDLRLNELTGPIPFDLLQCRRLEGLYLFDNYLTGTYPSFENRAHNVWFCVILIYISFHIGTIPDELSDLPKLSGVYLFNNNFTGTDRSRELFKGKLEERPCYVFI